MWEPGLPAMQTPRCISDTEGMRSQASQLPHKLSPTFFCVLFETELAPTFIDGNRHGVGQVQAAAPFTHRQTQAMAIR